MQFVWESRNIWKHVQSRQDHLKFLEKQNREYWKNIKDVLQYTER